MAIKIDFKKTERAIELPDGTVLDIPERTKSAEDKVQKILQSRIDKKEFDFLIEILEALFGKSGLKKIAPNKENVNLDYLTAVYTASVNAFYADKIEMENAEVKKKVEQLKPITNQLNSLAPALNKIK